MINENRGESVPGDYIGISPLVGYSLENGSCGLSDGSVAGDWRLPNIRELHSLFDVVASLKNVAFALEDPKPCALEENPEPASVRDVLGGDQKDCYKVAGENKLSTAQILALPSISLLLALQFLVFLAFNFYYVAFPVHASVGLGWSLGQVGA